MRETTFIKKGLPAERKGYSTHMHRIIHLTETDSTNKYIRPFAEAGEKVCVIADRQTAGRGRLGRTFESPVGGLYMSFTCPVADVAGDNLTAKAAVAAVRAIGNVTGLDCGIKWVNDIYTGGKKLCGILAEGVWQGGCPVSVIIGIGVNLDGSLPDYLADIATTVEIAGGRVPDREELATAILREFESLTDFYDEYRSRQIFLGSPVTVHRGGESYDAVFTDIATDFSAVLTLADGTVQNLSSGEISLRLK